jgi:Arylsulfotransferase (ASST)
MGGRGGGFGGNFLVQQDWCGNEQWNWEVVGGRWHHDYNRQGNPVGYYVPGMQPKLQGKTLVLANHTPEDAYDYPRSWVPHGHPAFDTSHVSNYDLIDDAIYMVDKKKRIKWQWFASQHFEQMQFSDAAKQGIMAVNVGRGGRTDWTHFNNVNFLGPNRWCQDDGNCLDPRFHPDNIIFDSRTSAMIGIIAHDDYPGVEKGDIVWQAGPEYGPGTPWQALGHIIGPHNAHMIPATLPGAGNIIVFDNGGNSSYGALAYGNVTGCPGTYPSALRDYSRVLEFDPITFEVVWEYENLQGFTDVDGNWNRKFFSSFISSVQRLVNGNTLITEGNQARIFEVTPDKEIVWEYIAAAKPGGPGVIGRALYRAYRYPKAWATLDTTCGTR